MPSRKIILALVFALSLVFNFFNFRSALSAQNYSDKESALEAKLDALSNNLRSSDREILRKLDQVLSSQEKIFRELEIIKVRASKR